MRDFFASVRSRLAQTHQCIPWPKAYRILDKSYVIAYIASVQTLVFMGSSRDDLRAFPEAVRRKMGWQLLRLQHGLDPTDWKPAKTVGLGVRGIRVHEGGQYRAFYVAHVGSAIYVLHAFRKKTQATPLADITLARKRLQQIGE